MEPVVNTNTNTSTQTARRTSSKSKNKTYKAPVASAPVKKTRAARQYASLSCQFVAALPPSKQRGNLQAQKFAEIMNTVREKKNQWARVATYKSPQAANSMATNIRKGKAAGSGPEGAFEARVIDNQVYVQFVG